MTHIPTGIVAACQAERSQHKNRAQALSMLKARLYEAELREREDGSYVLHPYQMIKDLRTNVETSNTSAVLDGDLDQFLEAALALKLGVQDSEGA